MEKLRTVVPVWTLYVEHGVNPSVKYYEKKLIAARTVL
jgi:hypothetical protein